MVITVVRLVAINASVPYIGLILALMFRSDPFCTNDPRSLPFPTGWVIPLERWDESLVIAGRSEGTRRQRLGQIRSLARELDVPDPGAVQQGTFYKWLSERQWQPSTRKSHYSSYRMFFGWAYRTGVVGEDVTLGLPQVTVPRRLPRPADDAVILLAMRNAPIREQRLITIGAQLGLRIGEIVKIHITDLIPDLAGYSLMVHGKGSKERQLPLPADLAYLLAQWCREGGGWAFPSASGGHISSSWASKLVSRALGEHATSHALRHRFATKAYSAERDIRALQELLGHSSISSTQIYTAPPPGALEATRLAD